MSGNCATGSAVSAITPAMVITVETTKASRGRRMNSDEIVMVTASARAGAAGARVGVTVMPGRTRLLALDDDLLARLEPLGDGHHAVARHAGLHATLLGHVLVVHDIDVGAGLVDGDGGLWDGDHGRRLGVFENHPHGLAVGQRRIGIVEGGAHDLAVGLGIDRDVDEVELALVLIKGAVGQPHPHTRRIAGAVVAPCFQKLAPASPGTAPGSDSPSPPVARTPESGPTMLPGDTEARADAAVDRRLDLGVGELDPGVAQLGVDVLELRLGLELLGQALVIGDLRAGVGA